MSRERKFIDPINIRFGNEEEKLVKIDGSCTIMKRERKKSMEG